MRATHLRRRAAAWTGLGAGALVLSGVVGLGGGGCASRDGGVAVALPRDGSSTPVRVHPLTRVRGASGEIDLHLEPEGADAAGSAKAGELPLGVLHAELVDATGAVERKWTVDLRDTSAAKARFDALVTRTWLITLGGVPERVRRWALDAGDESPGPVIRVWWEGASGVAEGRVGR